MLEWSTAGGCVGTFPTLLLGGAEGSVTVVDVKAASRLRDPDVVAQFALTGRLCEPGYRRSGLVSPELLPLVLGAAAAPVSVRDLERTLEGPGQGGLVRAATLHLLWYARLVADLSRPLGGATLVRAEAVA